MAATSVRVAPSLRQATPWAIASEAKGAAMWTPSRSPVSPSATSLTRPSRRPRAATRPLPARLGGVEAGRVGGACGVDGDVAVGAEEIELCQPGQVDDGDTGVGAEDGAHGFVVGDGAVFAVAG